MFFFVLLTFGCIALAVMSVYWLVVRPASVVNAQLESADPSLALIENSPLTTMTRAAEPINRIVPISAGVAAQTQKQMLHARYPSPHPRNAFPPLPLLLIFVPPPPPLT